MRKACRRIILTAIAVIVTGTTLGISLGCAREAAEHKTDEAFEQARPQLEDYLRQQKEYEVLMLHLDDVRQAAEVEIFEEALLTGGPEVVIATVNGEEILNQNLSDFEEHERNNLASAGMNPYGEEANRIIEDMRPDILNNLVANTALIQKAIAEGTTPNEEAIEAQYQSYIAQAGSEEELEEQLAVSGYTLQDLRGALAEQAAINTYVDAYLAETLTEEDLAFTEEELRKLYDELVADQESQPGLPYQPLS